MAKYGVGVGSERRRLSPEIETERIVAYPRKEKPKTLRLEGHDRNDLDQISRKRVLKQC